jgi:hypothetical protein
VYSAYLGTDELKRFATRSNLLLKKVVTSATEFTSWIKSAHELLSEISDGENSESVDQDFTEGSSKKGLISRKAISTYYKQWELFSLEKLGPTFSIEINEADSSPLTSKLNSLEEGAARTWTTMLGDITEAKSSAVFQKRANALTERATSSVSSRNLENYDLEINGRPLKIQLSSRTSEDTVHQFVKAMKAQFLVYAGKGPFSVSLQSGGSMVTVSLLNASKADIKKIEEILLQLI